MGSLCYTLLGSINSRLEVNNQPKICEALVRTLLQGGSEEDVETQFCKDLKMEWFANFTEGILYDNKQHIDRTCNFTEMNWNVMLGALSKKVANCNDPIFPYNSRKI